MLIETAAEVVCELLVELALEVGDAVVTAGLLCIGVKLKVEDDDADVAMGVVPKAALLEMVSLLVVSAIVPVVCCELTVLSPLVMSTDEAPVVIVEAEEPKELVYTNINV